MPEKTAPATSIFESVPILLPATSLEEQPTTIMFPSLRPAFSQSSVVIFFACSYSVLYTQITPKINYVEYKTSEEKPQVFCIDTENHGVISYNDWYVFVAENKDGIVNISDMMLYRDRIMKFA